MGASWRRPWLVDVLTIKGDGSCAPAPGPVDVAQPASARNGASASQAGGGKQRHAGEGKSFMAVSTVWFLTMR